MSGHSFVRSIALAAVVDLAQLGDQPASLAAGRLEQSINHEAARELAEGALSCLVIASGANAAVVVVVVVVPSEAHQKHSQSSTGAALKF